MICDGILHFIYNDTCNDSSDFMNRDVTILSLLATVVILAILLTVSLVCLAVSCRRIRKLRHTYTCNSNESLLEEDIIAKETSTSDNKNTSENNISNTTENKITINDAVIDNKFYFNADDAMYDLVTETTKNKIISSTTDSSSPPPPIPPPLPVAESSTMPMEYAVINKPKKDKKTLLKEQPQQYDDVILKVKDDGEYDVINRSRNNEQTTTSFYNDSGSADVYDKLNTIEISTAATYDTIDQMMDNYDVVVM